MPGQMPAWLEELQDPPQMPEWLGQLGREAEAAPRAGLPAGLAAAPGTRHMLTAAQRALYDRAVALRGRQREQFGDVLERVAGVAHLGPVFGGTGLTATRAIL